MEHAFLVLDHAAVEPGLEVVGVELARVLVGEHGALGLVIILESKAEVRPDLADLVGGEGVGVEAAQGFLRVVERAGVDELEDVLELEVAGVGQLLGRGGLDRGLVAAHALADFVHQRGDESRALGDVVARGVLEVGRGADVDALGLERGEEKREVALEEFEPLGGRDGARQAHGARRGLADGGGLGEQCGHFLVELLLDVGPVGVDRGGGAGLDPAAVDGEATAALDQRGGARTVVRRALHAHGLRRDHRGLGGLQGFFRRRAIGLFLVQALESLDDLLFDGRVVHLQRHGPLVDGAGRLGRAEIFLEVEAEAVEQLRGLRRARQLDEVLFLARVERDGMDRGRGQRLLAAGRALLLLGFLIGVLGLLTADGPYLLDGGEDDLQGLKRLDRLLVKAENQELAPVADLGRIALEFTKDVLCGLGGEIHG